MPIPTSGSVRLQAGDVVVRDPASVDREPIVGLADDERLFDHMMIRFSRTDMDGWFSAWLAELDAADRSYWPLVIDLAGSTVGFTMLSRFSTQVAELQWYVAPAQWGRGAAGSATSLVLPFAFETLGFHRIFATADPGNHASVRVLERAGFRREGRMRDYVLAHNGWRDRIMFALLSGEWEPQPSAASAGASISNDDDV